MKCDAHLYIADKHGDNEADMCCQLELGHDGEHKEVFTRYDHPVTVTWTVDEKPIKDEEEKERNEYYQRIWDFSLKLSDGKDEVTMSEGNYNEYRKLIGDTSLLPPYDNTIVLCKKIFSDSSYCFVIKNSAGDIDFISWP